MIAQLLGGIGLFLLGMVLLTDGLKAAAGDALRDVLARLTGGPVRALLAGIGTTALVQSSSATVLATIGFVSAGLLTFPQALGVVFGANLGTTSTGWLVSVLGLKLSIGLIALPLVGVGALLRLLTRGRLSQAGLALAGFGLIFVGIDVLQAGMQVMSERLDPARIPGAGWTGKLALLGIGFAMTVVMQSSSAAVATTLTALHAGAIGLEQGAILVIGQNVGTTATAGLAAIGASVPARRTVLAHVLFNVITGALAFLLVPVFLFLVRQLETGGWLAAGGAVSLAAFHTGFNVVGVLVLLPFARRFGVLIARLVPERGPRLARHLDPSVAEVPEVALEAARRAVAGARRAAAAALGSALGMHPERERLEVEGESDEEDLAREAAEALAATRDFLGRVRSADATSRQRNRHVAVLHALEHLERLIRLRERRPPGAPRADGTAEDETLATARARAVAAIRWGVAPEPGHAPAPVTAGASGAVPTARPDGSMATGPQGTIWVDPDPSAEEVAELEALSRELAWERRTHRQQALNRTAAGELDPDRALDWLEAMRWLDGVVFHLWRSAVHLAAARDGHPALVSGGADGEASAGVPDSGPGRAEPAA